MFTRADIPWIRAKLDKLSARIDAILAAGEDCDERDFLEILCDEREEWAEVLWHMDDPKEV
jgi:hypothetical protein